MEALYYCFLGRGRFDVRPLRRARRRRAGCSIGRRRAPRSGIRRPLGLPGRGCPLRGAARPRPRRRGRAAATAGDARSRGPSGAAAPRPGLSCLPQSLCAFCAQSEAPARAHASNRAAPLVRPTRDSRGPIGGRQGCLLVSYRPLAGLPSFFLLGTYRESFAQQKSTRPRSTRKRASEAALTNG